MVIHESAGSNAAAAVWLDSHTLKAAASLALPADTCQAWTDCGLQKAVVRTASGSVFTLPNHSQVIPMLRLVCDLAADILACSTCDQGSFSVCISTRPMAGYLQTDAMAAYQHLRSLSSWLLCLLQLCVRHRECACLQEVPASMSLVSKQHVAEVAGIAFLSPESLLSVSQDGVAALWTVSR